MTADAFAAQGRRQLSQPVSDAAERRRRRASPLPSRPCAAAPASAPRRAAGARCRLRGDRVVVYVGAMRLDDLDLVHQLAHAAELGVRRACASTSACSPTSAGMVSVAQPRRSSACCSSLVSLVLGFLLAVAHRPAGARREPAALGLPLSVLDVVRRHRPGLAVAAQSDLGIEKLVRDLGFERSASTGSCGQDVVIYTLVIAGVWHAAGLVMAIMLAGPARRRRRTSGRRRGSTASRPGASTSRSSLPMLRPSFATAVVLLVDQRGAALRPRRSR